MNLWTSETKRAHCIHLALTLFAFGAIVTNAFAQSAPDMQSMVVRLNQTKTTDAAARQILDVASRDSGAREYVVQRLSQMIDRPKSDEIWMNAVRLAGQLRSVESIPSLRTALSRGPLGGALAYSMTREIQLDDDVVGKALAQIGDPAIPSVTDLLASDDPKARRRAVLILRNMGTKKARKVLEERRPHENDEGIKSLIESGLRS